MRQLGFLLITGVTLCALLATPRIAAGEPVGFIAVRTGIVEVQETASSSWEAGLIDRDLEIGDILRTGSGSAAKVLLVDETMLTLGESPELEIESFLIGSGALRDPSVLRLLKGRARVVIGEAFGGPTRVEMHTPTAVIGVKGSAYFAELISDPLLGEFVRVYALSGRVWVRTLGARGLGRPIDLGVNSYIDVLSAGRVSGPHPGRPPGLPAGSELVPELQGEPEPGAAEGMLFGPAGVAAGGTSGARTPLVVIVPVTPTLRAPSEVFLTPTKPFIQPNQAPQLRDEPAGASLFGRSEPTPP